MSKKADIETTAEAYLELLAARGVEYFFGNAGTDFAPIIEAYARRGAHGQLLPRPITVPHEVPAVAMAHGYAMVTGRPQAVMVHVIVGTANALGGVINAARGGVPMLFTAGRNPITEAGFRGSRERQIHWAQESFDQGAIVREFVKWDYELRNFAQLETVVDRAPRRRPLPHPRELPPGPSAARGIRLGAPPRRSRRACRHRIRRPVVPPAQEPAARRQARPDRRGPPLLALPDPRLRRRRGAGGNRAAHPRRAHRRPPVPGGRPSGG